MSTKKKKLSKEHSVEDTGRARERPSATVRQNSGENRTPLRRQESNVSDRPLRRQESSMSAREQPIELLSPKQNGTVDPDRESQKAQKATIKGMWRKAFRSLKQSKSDKTDTKYSKLSQRRSFLKRKDSKEAQDEAAADAEEIDPVYSLLKCAADLPKTRHQSACQTCHTGNSPKTHRSASQVGQTNLAASATSDSLNVKSTGSSRSSSPSSAPQAPPCACSDPGSPK